MMMNKKEVVRYGIVVVVILSAMPLSGDVFASRPIPDSPSETVWAVNSTHVHIFDDEGDLESIHDLSGDTTGGLEDIWVDSNSDLYYLKEGTTYYKVSKSNHTVLDQNTMSISDPVNGDYSMSGNWIIQSGGDGEIEVTTLQNMTTYWSFTESPGSKFGIDVYRDMMITVDTSGNTRFYNLTSQTLEWSGGAGLPDTSVGARFDAYEETIMVGDASDNIVVLDISDGSQVSSGNSTAEPWNIRIASETYAVRDLFNPRDVSIHHKGNNSQILHLAGSEQGLKTDGTFYYILNSDREVEKYTQGGGLEWTSGEGGFQGLGVEKPHSDEPPHASADGIEIHTDSYMEHGSEQPYEVFVMTGESMTDVTDSATVTSSNTSVVTVNNTSNVLSSTNDSSVNQMVSIDASYSRFEASMNVTVANATIDNFDILPSVVRVEAIFGGGLGGPNDPAGPGGGAQFQFIIFALMGGVVATKISTAFAGVGTMQLMLFVGWFAGWVSLGVMLACLAYAIFAGLNLALNIDTGIG